jgi:hypothetical protein
VIITALCVEWVKVKAHTDWWEEEVILLDEEMRRMLEFCWWKELWWAEQAPHHERLVASLAEGLQAYATEQADLEHHICLSWTAKWAVACQLARPIIQAAFGEEPEVLAQVAADTIMMLLSWI